MATADISSYRRCYGAILRLGLPILAGQLGMIATGFADNVMVGRYSTEALASASFVNNFFNVAILATTGFTYGLTPLIGAMYARRDNASIGATLRVGVVVNLVFASLLTVVMAVCYALLPRMGQPEELLPLIKPYYLLFLAGLLPISLFNVFAQWSYAVNNTRLPMWIILASNALNIVGNWMLIYGRWGMPEMGLTGAGIATLVCRLLCPVAIIAVFLGRRRYAVYRTGIRRDWLRRESVRRVWRTGLPVAGQLACETGSFSVAAIMAGWLGAIELAAYQIMVIVGMLGFCIYYGVGSAVAVLVSNATGAGDRRATRRVAWAGYHILLVIMVLSSLTFLLAGRYIMGIFTADEVVLTMAVTLIPPMILYQTADASQVNFSNSLRGTSNVMPMLWIAFTSYIVVGVPVTYLMAFPLGMGLVGIVYSFSVSLAMAACLFLYFFLRTTRSRQSTSA